MIPSVPCDPNNQNGINLRINMGAYGGTAQASMAPHGWVLLSDMNNNGLVSLDDLLMLLNDWLEYVEEHPADLNRDGLINFKDIAEFANEWMEKLVWFEFRGFGRQIYPSMLINKAKIQEWHTSAEKGCFPEGKIIEVALP